MKGLLKMLKKKRHNPRISGHKPLTYMLFFMSFSLLMLSDHVWSATVIEIDAARIMQRISPLLWGGNIPGWDVKKGNLDPQVKTAIKDLNLSVLRFPGGNVSDGYHWENGIGNYQERKKNELISNLLGYRKGLVSSELGINEFMIFCKELNAKPLITVNCGNGTAEEAANWVEYCNGDASTKYGKLRIAHGFPEPYNIKYWEVGNEIYGINHKFQMTAGAYTEKFIRFCKLMKEKDPTINIGVIGALTKKHLEWAYQVLEKAGQYADFISFHVYYPRDAGQHLDREDFARAVLAGPTLLEKQLMEIKNHPLIKKNGLQIAFTEFNTQYSLKDGRHTRKENSDLKSALTVAGIYQAFIRNDVFMGNIWAVYEKSKLSLIRRSKDKIIKIPTYHVLLLYANDFGTSMVATQVHGPFFEAPSLKRNTKPVEVPTLSCLASISEDKKSLYLIVINRDLHHAVDASINIKHFTPALSRTVWTLTGPDAYSYNDGWEEPVTYEKKIEKRVFNSGLPFLFPALSLTKIKWEAQ